MIEHLERWDPSLLLLHKSMLRSTSHVRYQSIRRNAAYLSKDKLVLSCGLQKIEDSAFKSASQNYCMNTISVMSPSLEGSNNLPLSINIPQCRALIVFWRGLSALFSCRSLKTGVHRIPSVFQASEIFVQILPRLDVCFAFPSGGVRREFSLSGV